MPAASQKGRIVEASSITAVAYASDAADARRHDFKLSKCGNDAGLGTSGMFRVGWGFGSASVVFPCHGGWSLRPGTKIRMTKIPGRSDADVLTAKSCEFSNVLLHSHAKLDSHERQRAAFAGRKCVDIDTENIKCTNAELMEVLPQEGDDDEYQDQCSTLELLTILFEHIKSGPKEQKRLSELRRWLAKQARRNHHPPRSGASDSSSSASSQLLEFASSFSVWDLAQEAVEARGMPRLAAIVSQGVGSHACRSSAERYIQLHEDQYKGGWIRQDFWDVMNLLAGRIRYVQPAVGGFTWTSSLGLELWYKGGPHRPLDTCLQHYEADIARGDATPPLPRHLERNAANHDSTLSMNHCKARQNVNVYDGAFCLLWSWAYQRHNGVLEQPERMLHPQCFSSDNMDVVLPFTLMRILWSLNALAEGADAEEVVACNHSAVQLEALLTREFVSLTMALATEHNWLSDERREALVLSALRASLSISHTLCRSKLTYQMLHILSPLWRREELQKTEIPDYCPPAWLSSAKALFFRSTHEHGEELEMLRRQIREEGEAVHDETVERANALYIGIEMKATHILSDVDRVAKHVHVVQNASYNDYRFTSLARALKRYSQAVSVSMGSVDRDLLKESQQVVHELMAIFNGQRGAAVPSLFGPADRGMDKVAFMCICSQALCCNLVNGKVLMLQHRYLCIRISLADVFMYPRSLLQMCAQIVPLRTLKMKVTQLSWLPTPSFLSTIN